MSETQELNGNAMVSNQAVGLSKASRNGRWPKAALWTGNEMYAAAGMVSTARDMGTYMTALLAGRLLNPATYEMMWTATPTPQYGANPPYDAVYGLGWDTAIDTSAGPVQVTKSGSVRGFTTQLILDPATDSGVFITLNANYRGANPSNALAYNLAASILQASSERVCSWRVIAAGRSTKTGSSLTTRPAFESMDGEPVRARTLGNDHGVDRHRACR